MSARRRPPPRVAAAALPLTAAGSLHGPAIGFKPGRAPPAHNTLPVGGPVTLRPEAGEQFDALSQQELTPNLPTDVRELVDAMVWEIKEGRDANGNAKYIYFEAGSVWSIYMQAATEGTSPKTPILGETMERDDYEALKAMYDRHNLLTSEERELMRRLESRMSWTGPYTPSESYTARRDFLRQNKTESDADAEATARAELQQRLDNFAESRRRQEEMERDAGGRAQFALQVRREVINQDENLTAQEAQREAEELEAAERQSLEQLAEDERRRQRQTPGAPVRRLQGAFDAAAAPRQREVRRVIRWRIYFWDDVIVGRAFSATQFRNDLVDMVTSWRNRLYGEFVDRSDWAGPIVLGIVGSLAFTMLRGYRSPEDERPSFIRYVDFSQRLPESYFQPFADAVAEAGNRNLWPGILGIVRDAFLTTAEHPGQYTFVLDEDSLPRAYVPDSLARRNTFNVDLGRVRPEAGAEVVTPEQPPATIGEVDDDAFVIRWRIYLWGTAQDLFADGPQLQQFNDRVLQGAHTYISEHVAFDVARESMVGGLVNPDPPLTVRDDYVVYDISYIDFELELDTSIQVDRVREVLEDMETMPRVAHALWSTVLGIPSSRILTRAELPAQFTISTTGPLERPNQTILPRRLLPTRLMAVRDAPQPQQAPYIVRGQIYIWHNPMSVREHARHFLLSLRGSLLADTSFGLSEDDLATLQVTVAPRIQGRKYDSETSTSFEVAWYIRITFSLTTAERAKAITFAGYFNNPNRIPQTDAWYANTWAIRLGLVAADVVKGTLPSERKWTINDALFDPNRDGSLYGSTNGERHYY